MSKEEIAEKGGPLPKGMTSEDGGLGKPQTAEKGGKEKPVVKDKMEKKEVKDKEIKPESKVAPVKKEEVKVEEKAAEKGGKSFGKQGFRGRKKFDRKEMEAEALAKWAPKTELGKKVKQGEIKDLDFILDNNLKILESEIVGTLIDVDSDLISIGQAKGKFGGGKRRAWRQTQRKTRKGNVLSFSAMAAIGDKNGHVGLGFGKSKETLPSREKAVRKAQLKVIKIRRGCGSFDCSCKEPHTVPFKVSGKEGSVRIELMPAPQGTGLVINDQCKKILKLAGVKDVYSRTSGKVRTTFNLAKACIDALSKTTGDRRIE